MRDLYRPQRNWGARFHALTRQGLDMLVLENEGLRASFAVGRGADLVELLHKPTDTDFVWLSANGIRHPALRELTPPDARMAFYDSYPGGWQEVFPAGGAPSRGPGLPFGSHGMHGEVWHRPWDWDILDDHPEGVRLRMSVRAETLPYRLVREVTLEARSPTLRFDEVATNDSAVDLPLIWGHHITFGRPFIGPGATIEMPQGVEIVTGDIGRSHPARRLAADRVMPWHAAMAPDGVAVDMGYLPEAGSPGEMSYLRNFREGRYVVRNGSGLGLAIGWDAGVMPFVWCWQEFGAMRDYPWFGRHYNLGLEPFTSMPREGLAAAVENGTVSQLKGGESRRFTLSATAIAG